MSSKNPLPARLRPGPTLLDPGERLTALRSDVDDAKTAIRTILDRLAERQGISTQDVTYAIENYADHMLSDLIFQLERNLQREIGGETD